MSDPVSEFGRTAAGFARNPLGIVALFIVMIYAFASLVLAAGSSLQQDDRHILVIFPVLFPLIVLLTFCWLVAKHSQKLFGPGDFRDEANFVRMQLTAVASLTAAAGKSKEIESETDIDNIVRSVNNMTRGSRRQSDHRKCILWVDDRPENNVFERKAFEAVGFKFSLALSTEEAFEQLKSRHFDAIISDMGRVEGPREGYVLLDRLRAEGNKIPLFFYAASNAPAHKRETDQHGGQGCTNDGQELFEMVVRAMVSSAA